MGGGAVGFLRDGWWDGAPLEPPSQVSSQLVAAAAMAWVVASLINFTIDAASRSEAGMLWLKLHTGFSHLPVIVPTMHLLSLVTVLSAFLVQLF